MILFEKDFEEQKAIIHSATKNESFIKMHFLLKKMHVKNNAFFLALHQPELKNINPHNLKDPSVELAAKIALECKINPWYYLREVIRYPPIGGTEPMKYLLHRGNLFLAWVFYNHIDLFLTIPRQTGKTASSVGIQSGLIFFQSTYFAITLLTKASSNAKENVALLKSIREYLPKYLVDFNRLQDTDNVQEFYYAKLHNKYRTRIASNSEATADNLGRGDVTPSNHIDEVPYCANIQITYPVLMNSTNMAAKLAKEAGAPYTNILTTTAGKLDTEEGRFTRTIIDKACMFHESFYDLKDNDELVTIVKKNSETMMLYAEFSYLQLGYTHQWFKERSSKSQGDLDQIARDYLNRWTSGGINSVLSTETLTQIKESQTSPVDVEIVNDYVFRWYEDKTKMFDPHYGNRTIVMGLDTSENIGQDFTSLVFIDSTDLSVLGAARCNDGDLVALSLHIASLLIKYENTILVPERKSTASVMLSLICGELRKNKINPYTRIYNTIIQHKNEKPYNEIDIHQPNLELSIYKKYLGYSTAGAGENSRTTLYNTTLTKSIRLNHTRIRDAVLINELSSLTSKNGRLDHSSGNHDDTVIAYLLACYFVLFGKNLNYYDVDTSTFLNSVTDFGDTVDPIYKQDQLEIRKRIEQLEKIIKSTDNRNVLLPLQNELNTLSSYMDTSIKDTTVHSAEQLRQSSFDKQPITANSLVDFLNINLL